MLYPYTAALSRESKHWVTEPRKDLWCKAIDWGGRAVERTGRLWNVGRLSQWNGKEHRMVQVRGTSPASAKRITFLQSLELKHEYRGGWCIPRTNHAKTNREVVLRANENKFVSTTFWKVDCVVYSNFPSCPLMGRFHSDSVSFLHSTNPATLTIKAD